MLTGALLTWNARTWTTVSPSAAVERSLLLLGLIASIGVLLWCRETVGISATSIAFGIGAVVGLVPDILAGGTTWRFTFSIPITVLTLAVVSARGRLLPQLATLLTLILIGALNGARSNTALLAVVAAVLIWQRMRTVLSPGRRNAGSILSLILLVAGVALVAQAAVLEGYFGQAAEDRSRAQIEESGGSLILGGRPEAAASWALITRHPWGMGSGTVATFADVNAAKTAMAGIGYDPHNGYVNRYLFGGGVEVHSLLGDFWLWYGLLGVALCIVIAVILGIGIDRLLRDGLCTALPLFLALRFLWDLAFSPAITSVKLLPLTVVILAVQVVFDGRQGTGAAAQKAPGAALMPSRDARRATRL